MNVIISKRFDAVLKGLQVVALAGGISLLAVFAAVLVDAQLGSARGITAFGAARADAAAAGSGDRGLAALAALQPAVAAPDQSLWAPGRIQAYRESLGIGDDMPMGVLRIPTLELEVPIFDGTDDIALNRGVGRIEGTAAPGEPGNLGLAGHRDGFFRVLKDIGVGALISIEHLGGQLEFRVTETIIVDPQDTWVLRPTDGRTLTLVTCYPFYFVGHAPQRFIVRGELAGQVRPANEPGRDRGPG